MNSMTRTAIEGLARPCEGKYVYVAPMFLHDKLEQKVYQVVVTTGKGRRLERLIQIPIKPEERLVDRPSCWEADTGNMVES